MMSRYTIAVFLFVNLGICTRGEIIDLSHDLDENTLVWPTQGAKPFSLDVFFNGSFAGGWVKMENMETATHLGTHMDAPLHFSTTGWSVADIPAERLIAPAVMVDIREQASISADTNLTAAVLRDWERDHGRIPKGAVVFQCSGWTDKYPDFEAYFGGPQNGSWNFHFPGFSLDAAEFLVEQREVVGLAVDTPSTDYGASPDFPEHFYLAEHNVYGLENVKDPCRLPVTGATVYVATPKIVGASGSPARVIAMWDTQTPTGQGVPLRQGVSLLVWCAIFVGYMA